MSKFVIKLRVARYTHSQLLAFAKSIASGMDGNLNYPTPNPTLLDLGAMITDFEDALTAWGTDGTHGSSLQHEVMLDARSVLETGLTALANFCENTTPYGKTAFMSANWEVKKQAEPVGPVGPVRDFHQVISTLVPSGAVKLRWKLPADVPAYAISVYRVLNASVPDINSASLIALTTKATYTDLDAGSRASNFYWVIPVCVAGNGGIADAVFGYPQGPVVL